MIGFFLSNTELGQAGLAVLVAVIGYFLHRKAGHIEVLVNGRLTDALTEIIALRARVGVFEQKLGLSPGEAIPSAAVVTQLSEHETTPDPHPADDVPAKDITP